MRAALVLALATPLACGLSVRGIDPIAVAAPDAGVDASPALLLTTISTSGPVNTYVAITAPASGNVVRVQSASDVTVGAAVLVWQVNVDDLSAGGVTLEGSVGRYGVFHVTGVTDLDVTLDSPLGFDVEALGAQLITVPEYGDLTIATGAMVTALPWDGTKGGVMAMLVAGTATIDGIIDVTGTGFRGGPTDADKKTVYGCKGGEGAPMMGYAPHGEGIARKRFTIPQGPAVETNGPMTFGGGGGGGACHNGGGAGGGHGGGGGRGGDTYIQDAHIPGRFADGGGRLVYEPRLRIAFGGGGGQGEHNDSTFDNAGGVGGGIVFLRARSIAGQGAIRARGGDGFKNDGDSGTGGGAGGLVVVDGESPVCLDIDVGGGKGGDNDNNGGPGGGGGPGRIAASAVADGCAKLIGVPGAAGRQTGSLGGTNGAGPGETTDPLVILPPRD